MLCKELKENYNFSNVKLLNNFRNVNYPIIHNNSDRILKLVFFARVQPMKGANLIFDIANKIKKNAGVEIDIYGPVSDFYKMEFDRLLSESNVAYKGILQPDQIYSVLSRYDLMLFPTKYYTEGFPGSILDSYIAGVPVIVTNWLNAREFVDDGETGFIVEFDNDEQFIERTISLINEPELVKRLKENVVKKRYLYTSEQAWKALSLSLK